MPVAASDIRGLKRICMSCGTRFYDLNKRPVVCPGCSTEFTGEMKVKGRRTRLSPVDTADDGVLQDAATEKAPEAGDDEIVSDEDVVSLEDVEDMEDGEEDEADMEMEGDLEDMEEIEEDLEDEEIDVDIDEEDLKG